VSGEATADSPAARLAGVRARLGLSQEQLARQLGVSFATVNRWETGHTQMSARAARALADFEARSAAAGEQPRPRARPPGGRDSALPLACEAVDFARSAR
jgi:putative transcriptional regulator